MAFCVKWIGIIIFVIIVSGLIQMLGTSVGFPGIRFFGYYISMQLLSAVVLLYMGYKLKVS